MLSFASRQWLLFVARDALAGALGARSCDGESPPRPIDAALDEPARAFVSWHRGAQLVGCIGTLAAQETLEATVRRYAVRAGLHDPRLPPATAADLPDLHAEISVLSEPAPLKAVGLEAITAALVPGRDGVVLKTDQRRGVFLPSVWAQLPTPEAFVAALCRKAGIDVAADGDRVRAEVFRAQVMDEREAG